MKINKKTRALIVALLERDEPFSVLPHGSSDHYDFKYVYNANTVF